MATLYVENVPDKLYAALRAQAQKHNKSIAAEVMEMLKHYVVTPEQIKARQEIRRISEQLRALPARVPIEGADAVSMLREDRSR